MAASLAFTIAEAVTVPEMAHLDEQQLGVIVSALRWQSAGTRRNGKPGRPAATYDAARLMRLCAALAPFTEQA